MFFIHLYKRYLFGMYYELGQAQVDMIPAFMVFLCLALK